MVTRDFSGRDLIKALTKNNFVLVGRTGSHVRLRYEHPERDDDVRLVSVLMHDRIREGTLRSIMRQCGGEDFESFCEWIDENRGLPAASEPNPTGK